MITSILSLSHVVGAEIMLIYWLTCAVLYLIFNCSIKHNRTKAGMKTVLTGLFVAEILIDLIWYNTFYDHGSYINHGIGSVYFLLLWIPVLMVTSITVLSINKKKSLLTRLS